MTCAYLLFNNMLARKKGLLKPYMSLYVFRSIILPKE